jgi:prephenate dehydratase
VALAQRKINLTKLESRVNPESPWEYYFYLDIEGHSEDALVKEALEEVAAHANSIKILGCYTRRDQ